MSALTDTSMTALAVTVPEDGTATTLRTSLKLIKRKISSACPSATPLEAVAALLVGDGLYRSLRAGALERDADSG